MIFQQMIISCEVCACANKEGPVMFGDDEGFL